MARIHKIDTQLRDWELENRMKLEIRILLEHVSNEFFDFMEKLRAGGVDILIHGLQASKRFVYDQREQKSLERDFLLLMVSTVSEPNKQAAYHTWSRTIIRRLLPATNGSTAVVPFPKPMKANLRTEETANGFSTLVLSADVEVHWSDGHSSDVDAAVAIGHSRGCTVNLPSGSESR